MFLHHQPHFNTTTFIYTEFKEKIHKKKYRTIVSLAKDTLAHLDLEECSTLQANKRLYWLKWGMLLSYQPTQFSMLLVSVYFCSYKKLHLTFPGSGALFGQKQAFQASCCHCRRCFPWQNWSPKKLCKELEPSFIQYPVSSVPDKLKSSIPRRINTKPSNNQLHLHYTNSLLPKLLKSTRIWNIREVFIVRQRLTAGTAWASACSDTASLLGSYWTDLHSKFLSSPPILPIAMTSENLTF